MKNLVLLLAMSLTFNVFAAEVASDLTTVSVTKAGEKLLADSRGNILYVFDVDLNQTTSKCNATCAEIWPPYLITAEEAAKLVAPLGSIVRDNGKPQLTYNGRAVYGYAFDRGVADNSGDGVGGVWHDIQLLEE